MPTVALNTIPQDGTFFGLFVGESGSGKTTAAASFPKPILIIDVDRRAKGINGSPWINTEGIDVHYVDGKDILADIEKLLNEFEVNKRSFKYKTIIFDGFTSAAMLLIDNAFSLTSTMTGRKAQGHPKIGVVEVPGRDEYMYEQQGFKNLMTGLKYGLKCNVICTAHWVDVYSQEEGKQAVVIGKRINLRAKVLPTVAIWFDEVYYFEKEMAKRPDPVTKMPVEYEKHTVWFRNELARTTIAALPNKTDISAIPLWPILEKYHVIKEETK